jgi:hypothetical protein
MFKISKSFQRSKLQTLEYGMIFFIFSLTKEQKIEKQSTHVQKVLIYNYKPSKNDLSRDTIPLTHKQNCGLLLRS